MDFSAVCFPGLREAPPFLKQWSHVAQPNRSPAEPEHVRYSLERRLCRTDCKDISQPGGGTTASQAYMTRSLVEHLKPPDCEAPGISGGRSPVFFPSLKLCAHGDRS